MGAQCALAAGPGFGQIPGAAEEAALTPDTCTGSALAAGIPAEAIGEPVSAVVLDAVEWVAATENVAAHCLVNGRLQPVDTSDSAQAIRFAVALPEAEVMRQCDELDGRIDGVINNYVDCRALFNVNDGDSASDPWARLRCPDDVDPDPQDATVDACLTSGQIETINFVFSEFRSPTPLANGRETFGMWAPSTAVGGGSGFGPPGGPQGGPPVAMAPPGALFIAPRYRGQEGAAEEAPVFSALGSIGVNGFIMQDLDANPLHYDVERHGERRAQISPWLDSTDSDLGAFRERGGRLILIVGTDDTIVSSGEQLDYYQSVLEQMGRDAVDDFARFYVLPQTGHGLTGNSASIDGNGDAVQPAPIPSSIDRFALLRDWVENGQAPGISEIVTGPSGSRPMCSYPTYPHYVDGDPDVAQSYACAAPVSLERREAGR